MEVVCQNCKSRFKIPDDKLPPGRVVSIKCSKCEGKIEVDTKSRASKEVPAVKPETAAKEVVSDAYDPSEKPFDYLQEGMATALICEHDLKAKHKIRSVLEGMDYHVVEAASTRNALKYMRFHVYDLIVVNETFEADGADSSHVLQYLSQLPVSVRRSMFVVLLGDNYRTTDNMIAFNKSVNLVINLQDVDDIEKILKRALSEHAAFYQVFMESLKKTGRA